MSRVKMPASHRIENSVRLAVELGVTSFCGVLTCVVELERRSRIVDGRLGDAALPERAAVAKIQRLAAREGTTHPHAAVVLLVLIPTVWLNHCVCSRHAVKTRRL